MGYEALWPAGTLAGWHSGLLALWPLGCGTGNLSLSFFKLLVTTHSARNLERPRKPNSLQHAIIPATTEACIIASAGLDSFAGNRALLAVSCAWYSCLSGLVHQPVLKISHASVCVPGAREAFSLSFLRGTQILKSAVINWKLTLVRCQSFAHASIVLLDPSFGSALA